MLKQILTFSFAIGLAFSVQASDTLADVHTEMGGCENCHQDGNPSADFVHENLQCESCHGTPAEVGGEHHQVHGDKLMCADCHQPHKMELDAKPACETCHG